MRRGEFREGCVDSSKFSSAFRSKPGASSGQKSLQMPIEYWSINLGTVYYLLTNKVYNSLPHHTTQCHQQQQQLEATSASLAVSSYCQLAKG